MPCHAEYIYGTPIRNSRVGTSKNVSKRLKKVHTFYNSSLLSCWLNIKSLCLVISVKSVSKIFDDRPNRSIGKACNTALNFNLYREYTNIYLWKINIINRFEHQYILLMFRIFQFKISCRRQYGLDSSHSVIVVRLGRQLFWTQFICIYYLCSHASSINKTHRI